MPGRRRLQYALAPALPREAGPPTYMSAYWIRFGVVAVAISGCLIGVSAGGWLGGLIGLVFGAGLGFLWGLGSKALGAWIVRSKFLPTDYLALTVHLGSTVGTVLGSLFGLFGGLSPVWCALGGAGVVTLYFVIGQLSGPTPDDAWHDD